MKLEKGDMWSVYDQSDLFLITANSSLLSSGELIMGAGIAKQAKERFPELPFLAGKYIGLSQSYEFYGLIVFGKPEIGLFQTKTYWRKPSTLQLIMKSTVMLLDYITLVSINREKMDARTINFLDKNKHLEEFRVDLNFPGIGKGNLSRSDVLPIISVLPDNVHIWENE